MPFLSVIYVQGLGQKYADGINLLIHRNPRHPGTRGVQTPSCRGLTEPNRILPAYGGALPPCGMSAPCPCGRTRSVPGSGSAPRCEGPGRPGRGLAPGTRCPWHTDCTRGGG